MTHAKLKTDIMIALQKKYLHRIKIYGQSVGNVYYKRNGQFVGPYKVGSVGLPDIYGFCQWDMFGQHPSGGFWIEVKVGRDKLSPEQIKRKKEAEKIRLPFIEARSVKQVLDYFTKYMGG